MMVIIIVVVWRMVKGVRYSIKGFYIFELNLIDVRLYIVM